MVRCSAALKSASRPARTTGKPRMNKQEGLIHPCTQRDTYPQCRMLVKTSSSTGIGRNNMDIEVLTTLSKRIGMGFGKEADHGQSSLHTKRGRRKHHRIQVQARMPRDEPIILDMAHSKRRLPQMY